MDIDFTGIDVLASQLTFYMVAALAAGIIVGWYCAVPSRSD